MMHSPSRSRPDVLVLQGGGALGAYQAGVYEALHQTGFEPDWIAGISIGAINAAIIAGNPAERRVERLRQFWDLVSSEWLVQPLVPEGTVRQWFNEWAAAGIMAGGVPGFFRPRPPVDWLLPGEMPPLGVYDTTPLRDTLLELVDFDRLNDGAMRVSVGAVNVRTGNFSYFDNRERTIGPEHVMASGALPPGFPPVMIDGEAWWDGGLVSNTPLQHVLDEAQGDLTVFQVDLFHALGDMPTNISEVLQRDKDIRYSSRTRMNTDLQQQLEELRLAAARLVAKLPPELQDDPDVRALSVLPRPGAVCVLHLINRREPFETQSKDYEFSRATVNGHWESGIADGTESLRHPLWQARDRYRRGIVTFDLTHPDGPQVRCGDEALLTGS
ncbi:patatin-like phospholipase family protein [Croceibacterium mercuriale]|uniref:patatin-like phospholipase family protein n=1 Tax=Croceibacterium mercuriale TaxID=1572751 RepID=UPI001269D5D1|nr:patatin-like phospholipase family protein [Croceibacterium mercuriale]